MHLACGCAGRGLWGEERADRARARGVAPATREWTRAGAARTNVATEARVTELARGDDARLAGAHVWRRMMGP